MENACTQREKVECVSHAFLGITWQDKVTNKVVLDKAGIPSLYTFFKQRRMRWLGHVTRMKDGRTPEDLLYGELATGKNKQDDPNYALRTYASETSRYLAKTQTLGKLLPHTEMPGDTQ